MKTNFVNNSVKAVKRAAFFFSLLVVIVLTVSALFVCVYLLTSLISVLGITDIAARFVIFFLFLLGPALEVAMNIEANALQWLSVFFPLSAMVAARLSRSAASGFAYSAKVNKYLTITKIL